jgi:ElaB/YqjD/DUF883 family membrane-anchored ribosome-binding protein
MKKILFAETSILGLVKELKNEVKIFIKEEAQLAKTELAEKLAKTGRNSIGLAIGGVIAYAGLILLLLGLGGLLGFGLQQLGMQPLLAAAIGVAVFGLIVAAIGAVFVLKGVKALSKESLAPQRTMKTLQAFKGVDEDQAKAKIPEEAEKEKPTAQEIEESIMVTETRLDHILQELSERLTLRHARETTKEEIQSHPYRWGGTALGAGALTGFLVKRKLQQRQTD